QTVGYEAPDPLMKGAGPPPRRCSGRGLRGVGSLDEGRRASRREGAQAVGCEVSGALVRLAAAAAAAVAAATGTDGRPDLRGRRSRRPSSRSWARWASSYLR